MHPFSLPFLIGVLASMILLQQVQFVRKRDIFSIACLLVASAYEHLLCTTIGVPS